MRPNQTRADLGYVEPSEGKKRRRDTVDDDGAGPSGESGGVGIGGGGGGSSSSRIPFGLTVDFCKLDMAALKRYKRHYRLKVRPNVTKGELANAVARHFASQTVDEADTISLFMCAPRPPPHRSHRAAPRRAVPRRAVLTSAPPAPPTGIRLARSATSKDLLERRGPDGHHRSRYNPDLGFYDLSRLYSR